MVRVVYAVGLMILATIGCGRPSPQAAMPEHPLIGNWSVVSINRKPLPVDGHVTVTFRQCGCSMINPHGNLDLAKLYDVSKITQGFREYQGPAPAVGEEIRLTGEGFEVVVRRVDADAPACCQNRTGI